MLRLFLQLLRSLILQATLLVYLALMINNRIISMISSQEKQSRPSVGKSGCYGSLKASQPDFQLPLKSFHYDVEIVQCFTQVKLTQIYYNSSSHRLDVDYIFPVHADSTISSLQVSFGGKKLAGVIMEKEIAEKQFDEHVNQGTQAAYSEYNPKSRDVIKLKVGNIAQKEEIKVEMCYTHLNSLVCNTFYEFRLASTITPRYASQLDASKLFFNSMPQSRNMQGKCFWSVHVVLCSKRKITKVESFTHKILQTVKHDKVSVTFDGDCLPDKDFSLYYCLEDYQKPTWSLSHSDNNTVAAISFIPKYCHLSVNDALKQAKVGKDFQVDLDSTQGQYIFLLDRSGSMGGVRIDNAKRSLEIFLRSLPDNSYFNVLSFGSSFEYLFQHSSKNTKEEIDKAVTMIASLDADMGGTEILMVLQDLVKKPSIPSHPRLLFFLTDGAVSNVSDVVEFVAKHTQHMRIYSIGIGNGCSEELIRGCAEKGKGSCTFITDDEKPEQKIISMLENALSPVISNIELEYDHSKVESVVPNPEKLPFILKNDLANFYFSFKGKLTQLFQVGIKYKDSTGKKYTGSIEIDPKGQSEGKWLHCLISYQKVRALCDSLQFSESQQDRIYYVKKINKEQLKEEVIEQSIKHQILTQYTAFLCVDASTADIIRQQASQRSKEKVSIRSMNPYDHKISYFNEKQGYNQDDESNCYINQCCVASWEPPPKELENICKFEEAAKLAKLMDLRMRVAGKPDYYTTIPGIKSLPNPQKRLAFTYIVKKQQADGSWHEDFLNSLFTDADELRKTFQKLVDNKAEYITFLVCQFLLRFYSNETQFALIIKKGKNYVQKKSRMKWAGMQAEFHKHYNPLS